MRKPYYLYSIAITLLIAVVTSAFYNTFSQAAITTRPDWAGVWVKTDSLETKEAIDQMLEHAEAAGFNMVFVNVVYEGQAFYNSRLLPKSPKVADNFDPLAYLIPKAHRKGIEVHAWFMIGKFGDESETPFFRQRHNWAMQRPDGEKTNWLNFNNPAVRSFLQDVIMELLGQYRVNGVHLDYTRYPGDQWGYDSLSLHDFELQTGVKAELLRFENLPAFGYLEGNPLISPTTAQVLAHFSNRLPAITLNHYGDGMVLLINWDATERQIAASSVILKRAIDQFAGSQAEIGIFYSDTNGKDYGFKGYEKVQNWIEFLGWNTHNVQETELSKLDSNSVLIMPNIYRISPASAAELEKFVNQGGRVIFIDGPTKSIHLNPIRLITGMASRGRYFNQALMLMPNGPHDLIPSDGKKLETDIMQDMVAKWTGYRQEGINTLIKDAYKRVKSLYPEVELSVTITSDIDETGTRYMQDWQDWLRYDYIDFLVPRAYAGSLKELRDILNDWEFPIERYPSKIKIGLITYTGSKPLLALKAPESLLKEIETVEKTGLNGFLIFHIENLNYLQSDAIYNYFSIRRDDN